MLGENQINREINNLISKFIYIDVMKMNILAVITPTSIYHGYSNRKTFQEENLAPANMKNCGCCNVRKHREIKNGDKYTTLDIYLDFGSMEKMKITAS